MREGIFILIGLFLLLMACSDDVPFNKDNEFDRIQISTNAEAMKRLAIVLSKAVSNDVELRKFIKEESLKQMDKDYDIFYPFTKNEIVYDNKTLKDILTEYETYEGEIQEIEELSPLLTIYVAELPNDINAITWDAEKEIPSVVYEFLDEGKQLFYKNGIVDFECGPRQFPQFTTLVVKRNERLKLKDNVIITKSNQVFESDQYEFIDEFFNPTIETKGDNWPKNPPYPRDPKPSLTLRDVNPSTVANGLRAYNAMGVNGYNWQRDNIYYGMTLTSDMGRLDRSIKEKIRYINFTKQGYYAMCDWDDSRQIRSLFVEGRYELKIDVYISNTSGLGSVITKYENRWFEELFGYINYIWVGPTVEPEAMAFNRWMAVDIVLPTWDLETNGFEWRISIQEVDAPQTITISREENTQFASNFEFNAGWGEKIKKGLKFGASASRSVKNTYTVQTHVDSDDLGTVEVSFSDPVLLGPSQDPIIQNLYPGYYRTYSTGNSYYNIIMCPYKAY